MWETIKDIFNYELIRVGSDENSIVISVGLLLLVVAVFIISSFVLRLIRMFLTRNLTSGDQSRFITVFNFIKYIIYILVLLATLSAAGINITILLTASAALFVGLGLALKELFQDIIGGLFILIDKSLLVGDVIEINGRVGRVFDIKLRTTRALTRDDKVIIIPNHKFISDTILNYTQNHQTTQENVQVGIAYGSDVNFVKELLLKCAGEQRGVLKTPKPFVLFEDFGESSLKFGVYFFITDSFIDPRIKSEIRFKIENAFRENNIIIPFPQRDLHIHTPLLEPETIKS